MKYEEIILNLLNRVQELEEQVAEIKNQIYFPSEELIERSIKTPTRNEAKSRAMDYIRIKYPDSLLSG